LLPSSQPPPSVKAQRRCTPTQPAECICSPTLKILQSGGHDETAKFIQHQPYYRHLLWRFHPGLDFATLMWFGRKSASLDARRAIALALFAQDSVGFIASLEIQLRGIANLFGWFSMALYAVLALVYAYFLFIKPQAS
jgi:hypothetical protein